MQTVNFQCGSCGNLMAVGVEYLGQQVRCPHCQQVVMAPGSDVPAPPDPPPPRIDDPFRILSDSPNEDIFHTKTEPEDAPLRTGGDAAPWRFLAMSLPPPRRRRLTCRSIR